MSSYPISFAIPDKKWEKYKELREMNQKENLFSDIIPGKSAYKYHEETDYILHYSKCLFAITFRKAGWEALRHYEILIAGTIPYFLKIEDAAEENLYCFPKDLLKKVFELPGVPRQEKVIENIRNNETIEIDSSLFDHKKYEELRNELLEYASKFMLCSHMVYKMLKQSNYDFDDSTNIALHSKQVWGPQDYQRDLICVGILELGHTLYTTFDISFLFDDFPSKFFVKLYGHGFTYGHSVSSERKKQWRLISSNHIPEDSIAIVHTKSNQNFPKDWDKISTSKKILVDGNDDYYEHYHNRKNIDSQYPIFYREFISIYVDKTLEEADNKAKIQF